MREKSPVKLDASGGDLRKCSPARADADIELSFPKMRRGCPQLIRMGPCIAVPTRVPVQRRPRTDPLPEDSDLQYCRIRRSRQGRLRPDTSPELIASIPGLQGRDPRRFHQTLDSARFPSDHRPRPRFCGAVPHSEAKNSSIVSRRRHILCASRRHLRACACLLLRRSGEEMMNCG